MVALAGLAQAGEDSFPAASPASLTSEAPWKIYGWVESGITFNPNDPDDRQNFGRLFDGRSNEPLLSQVVRTLAESTLTSSSSGRIDFILSF